MENKEVYIEPVEPSEAGITLCKFADVFEPDGVWGYSVWGFGDCWFGCENDKYYFKRSLADKREILDTTDFDELKDCKGFKVVFIEDNKDIDMKKIYMDCIDDNKFVSFLIAPGDYKFPELKIGDFVEYRPI